MNRFLVLASCLMLLVFTAAPARSSGFGIFEQGSRAMGMAGAFTAQADDGSALFHNVGGLGFLEDRQLSVGATYIATSEANFEGANPFPGLGARDEQETLSELTPHFYWIKPLNDRWKFGLSVNAPFGLSTEWDADTFSGRLLTTKAALRSIDVTPNLGLRMTDNLSVGFGVVLRFSNIELRRVQAAINPFTLQPAEIARVRLESDFESAYGWQAGLLHRPTDRLSWGFTYRSRIDISYGGAASFEQIPTGFAQFDALVAQSIPFGQAVPISTAVTFPDMASLGVAYALRDNLLVEVDGNWAGWSTFDEVAVAFGDESLDDLVLREDWRDVNNYRLGVRWTRGDREWRLGYVFDENPIPDETLGPLLPDADRNGFTVGWGHAPGVGGIDLALMFLPFDERTTLVNETTFNGTYDMAVWLFGATWTR